MLAVEAAAASALDGDVLTAVALGIADPPSRALQKKKHVTLLFMFGEIKEVVEFVCSIVNQC